MVSPTASPTTHITRITLFKIPSPADQELALEGYRELLRTNSKDGQPYIVSLEAGPTGGGLEDARAQGFNFVNKTVFRDSAGFEYYDKECAAHKTFRAMMREKVGVEGFMMVWFQGTVRGGVGME